MYMEKKMDAGAVLAQRAIPITEQDDVGTMFLKLSELGKNLLIETLPDFFQGNLVPQEQDESAATFSPNIKREEERIDWSKTAAQVAFKSVACVRGQWRIRFWMGKGSKYGLDKLSKIVRPMTREQYSQQTRKLSMWHVGKAPSSK